MFKNYLNHWIEIKDKVQELKNNKVNIHGIEDFIKCIELHSHVTVPSKVVAEKVSSLSDKIYEDLQVKPLNALKVEINLSLIVNFISNAYIH